VWTIDRSVAEIFIPDYIGGFSKNLNPLTYAVVDATNLRAIRMELGSARHFLLPVRSLTLTLHTKSPPYPLAPHPFNSPRQSYNHLLTTNSRIKLYSVNTTKPASAKRLQMYKDAGVDFLPLTRPAPFDLETEEEYLEEMRKREGRDPIE
jgi:hypothetical protein